MSSETTYQDLPLDAKLVIFSFFDYDSFCIAPTVCKEWKGILDESPLLFHQACLRLWNCRLPLLPELNWKRAYILICNCEYTMY
jgi:hypothetical protein